MACAFANLKAVLDDVFGIEIPMDEIERATTLEGLADYLGDKLRRTPNAISPDVVAAFLDIRRAVAVVMKRPKSEIQTGKPCYQKQAQAAARFGEKFRRFPKRRCHDLLGLVGLGG